MVAENSHLPRRERLVFWGLLALLAVAPVFWGGNRSAAWFFFGFVVALLSVLSLSLPAMTRSTVSRWPLWFAAVWLLYLGMQLLPLPLSLLARASPVAAAIHGAVPKGWNCLSLAPGAGVALTLLSFTFVQVYCLARRHLGRSDRIRILLWTITLAATAQALYGSVMMLSGIEWGAFEAKTVNRGVATGTFVNRNHLAAYLGLGLAAGIGLMLAESGGAAEGHWRQRLRGWLAVLLGPKLLLRSLLAVMVIALVLTRSRMGNIAFCWALTISGFCWLGLRPRANRRAALLFFISLVAVDILILSRYFGLDTVVERVQQTELHKEVRALVFADLVPGIRTHGIIGAGLGAFPSVFTATQTATLPERYDHAHNDYAEFLIEVGVVGLLPLALFTGWHLRRALQGLARHRRALPAGLSFTVLFALVALATHGLADFNLRIAAIPLTLMALLGSLAGCAAPLGKRSSGYSRQGIITAGTHP